MADVAVVDGIWMCTRRSVWEKNPFDDLTFRGFHFYDMDFSMQILQNFRVCVSFEIILEHFSLGCFNIAWIQAAFQFVSKWKTLLPVSTIRLSKKDIAVADYFFLKSFTRNLISNHYNIFIVIKYLSRCFTYRFYDKDNFWLAKRLVNSKIKDPT